MDNADLTRTLIFNTIKSCSFGAYLPDELKKLSVKQITSSESFDNQNRPRDGGFYDPSLGADSKFEECSTCHQRSGFCPGHIGHFDIILPVYNPVFFPGLLKLLKFVCLLCLDFRLKKKKIVSFAKRLKKIDSEDYFAAVDEKNIANTSNESKSKKKMIRKVMIEEFCKELSSNKCKVCGLLNPKFSKEKNGLMIKFSMNFKKSLRKLKYDYEMISMLKDDKNRFVYPYEIWPILDVFWYRNYDFLKIFFGFISFFENRPNNFIERDGYNLFFISTVAVTPIKYRPINRVNGQLMENEKSRCLSSIFKTNQELSKFIHKTLQKPKPITGKNQKGKKRKKSQNCDKKIFENAKMLRFTDNQGKNKKFDSVLKRLEDEKNKKVLLLIWFRLNSEYSLLFDSSSRSSDSEFGLKQTLEKKEGIIRSNMMGKRVNYTARSIVSPDLWIDSNEIGVPLSFATCLTFPETVTDQNVEFLKNSVINGAKVHPGANFVEDQFGWLIDLSTRTKEQRCVIANRLLENRTLNVSSAKKTYQNTIARKRVYRHLREGDNVVVNRQPTLHKASMMGHRVRILANNDSVIRMHYVNCNTYNADFDGDEINIHFPQNYVAKTECQLVTQAQRQYLSPKDASPLRGLVQDHVCGALLLSKRDTFFRKEQYRQYVYITLSLSDLERSTKTATIPPCILKPQVLWSGKQILSTILLHIAGDREKLFLDSKAQTPFSSFNERLNDPFMSIVTIRDGHWLTGVCDKASVGAKKFGLVSAMNELYGSEASDRLLTKLGKLFTTFLQDYGLTASTSDIVLSKSSEKGRILGQKTVNKSRKRMESVLSGLRGDAFSKEETLKIAKAKLSKSGGESFLDKKMKAFLNPISSEIIDAVLPHGMMKKFPSNNFTLMVLSGGKGSRVNISQICALLGQQELEGKRVPRTIAGKTLPCFSRFDLGAEAGGYIGERFLTGINPKMFFFHCMAGREGLVDTAIKTSRSGYLQRCLVKNLENISVCYDQTVRKLNGDILQFHYGEDGLDPIKSAYLYNFKFLQMNMEAYKNYYDEQGIDRLDLKAVRKLRKRNKERNNTDPIMSQLNYLKNLGCVSEIFSERLRNFDLRQNPFFDVRRKLFSAIANFKFLLSHVEPGDNVGILAGQSLGEPSTQMTLNTFHLAGHGGANVTLGIPRLREILMTGSKMIKTPTMDFGFLGDLFNPKLGCKFVSKLSPLLFSSLISKVRCTETKTSRFRKFKISIKLSPIDQKEVNWRILEDKIGNDFVELLEKEVKKVISGDILVSPAAEANEAKESDISEENRFFVDENGSYSDDSNKEKTGKNLETEESGEENDDDDPEKFVGFDNDFDKEKKLNEIKQIQITKLEKRFARASFRKEKNLIRISLKLPKTVFKSIFMNKIIKKLSQTFRIRHTEGISGCYALKVASFRQSSSFCTRVQTDGVNFQALYPLQDVIDINRIESNDIGAILSTYGIEACYRAIIHQIVAVFGVYGITIDQRHLSLIADAITWSGDYRAFNRISLSESESAFLKMSFESGLRVLQEACLNGEKDKLKSHSARLIMGQLVRAGTGSFDLLQKLN